MFKKRAFTLIELLVVISIIALLIGILLPALGAARKNAQRMENSTRVRGIQQAMFQYAQGNRQKYPGLGKDRYDTSVNPAIGYQDYQTTRRRLQLLIEGNFFTAEYVISPVETSKTPNSVLLDSGVSGDIPTNHFSYALLQIGTSATDNPVGRVNEWGSTANSEAAVVFDRNITTTSPIAGGSARSIHSATDWRGSVAYNDNHVFFETTNILERSRYGSTQISNDDMWAEEGTVGGTNVSGSNALGIYNY